MIPVIALCALAALGGVVYALLGPLRTSVQELTQAVTGVPGALQDRTDLETDAVRVELIELRELVDRLPQKWEDVKRESNSLYKRAHYHVKRATDELQERGLRDTELDELNYDLRLVDGGSGDGEGLPAVHSDMEGDPATNAAAPVENYLTLANRRKFGNA